MNATLQREIDDLAPAVKAWARRERAFTFVLHAKDHQLDVALIEWVLASHELVDALTTAAERADFRHQLDLLEVAS